VLELPAPVFEDEGDADLFDELSEYLGDVRAWVDEAEAMQE
jgi:hypothetical protein